FTAPSMALGAARNLIEGRPIDAPPKPTGGWPSWCYTDHRTGTWQPIDVLRQRIHGCRQSEGLTPNTGRQVPEMASPVILGRVPTVTPGACVSGAELPIPVPAAAAEWGQFLKPLAAWWRDSPNRPVVAPEVLRRWDQLLEAW